MLWSNSVPRGANRRLIRALVSAFVLVLVWALNTYAPKPVVPQLQAGTYRVITVDDGDTIIVDMNGAEEKVRLIGVDTPETKDPRKPVQCFGYRATEFTANLIGDNPVRLEADPTNTNRDRYNRLLRYVYLPDGTLVNLKIIAEGYGFAYVSFPVQKMEEFRAAEKQAREANRGLWAGCEPIPNEYGGFDSNPAE